MSKAYSRSHSMDLWVKLYRSFSSMNKSVVDFLRGQGLTQPQFYVLEVLYHKGSMTLIQLSRKLMVTGGNMTLIADNLEKEELIARVLDKSDRRKYTITVTAKGEEYVQKVFAEFEKHIESIASTLNSEEQVQAAKLLKKLGLGFISGK